MKMPFEVKLAALLLLSAAFFYIVNYSLFHDLSFIERYLLAQLGFLPISVLLVTLILNKMMVRREKRERIEKLNIVIGAFFAEFGKDLLRYLSKYHTKMHDDANELLTVENFSDADFESVKRKIADKRFSLNIENMNLYELRRFLLTNREFVVNLLGNPAIIEHEAFTDLLWNVLHLGDELKMVVNAGEMSQEDREDLRHDMEKLYSLLIYEWINYVHYLKSSHPHIFVYEAKTNPLVPHSYMVKKRKIREP